MLNILEFEISIYSDTLDIYCNKIKNNNILHLILYLLNDATNYIEDELTTEFAEKILNTILDENYFNIPKKEKLILMKDITAINNFEDFKPSNLKLLILKRWDTVVKLAILKIALKTAISP